ncbi:MAG: 30S ribosomal protein S8 [Candidatus Woesearchaeota archaeon]
MSLNDPLAATLSKIENAERQSKKECNMPVYSKMILGVLNVMKDNGYVGDIEEREGTRVKSYKINLLGRINRCNAIKPRYAVTLNEFEKFEKRYLPAKDFGIIIISTSKGLMTHTEAKKNNLGGRLIAFCY